jgi:hypothetical protein
MSKVYCWIVRWWKNGEPKNPQNFRCFYYGMLSPSGEIEELTTQNIKDYVEQRKELGYEAEMKYVIEGYF